MATKWLVVWWQTTTPYAAMFSDEVQAGMAAKLRNALVIEVTGDSKVAVSSVVDYWRRDDQDRPMPAEWREIK